MKFIEPACKGNDEVMSVQKEKNSFKVEFSLYRRLFSRAEKRRLILFLLLQSSLAFLDLLGVLLFGLLGSMLLFGVPYKSEILIRIFNYIHFDEINFRQQILILSLMILLILVGRTLISSLLTRKLNLFLAKKNAKLSAELLRRILYAERSKVENISQQEFLMSIVRGTHSFLIRQVASFFGLFVDVILLFVLFGGLFVIEPLVSTLTIVIFALLAVGIYKVTHGRVGRFANSELKYSVKVNERVLDVLNSSRIIKINGDSEFFVKNLESEKLSQARALAELAYLPIFNKYASEIGLVVAGFGFGAVVFTLFENTRAITFLGIFLAASMRIAPALLRIQQHFLNLKASSLSSRSFSKFFDQFDPKRSTGISMFPNFDCSNDLPEFSISVENVSVTSNSGRDILKDISFIVPFGTKLGIIGESGAGKSTLLDVLLGLRSISSGKIRFGCSMNMHPDCYSQGIIGFMPQQFGLIRGSIRDNVLLGRSNFSDDQILELLLRLGLSDLLASCKSGLDTLIGDGAKQVSGGEAQRIVLASALISSPKILIMDEGTSALDVKNQDLVMEYLTTFMPNVTLIVVAHQIATIKKFDQVLHLQDGEILSKGRL